jgi:hypothetical protein
MLPYEPKSLDLSMALFYYCAADALWCQANARPKEYPREEERTVVKVNQEELAGEIKKLKEKAKAAKEKAGGKRSEPALRKARKKVKRAQRKLRVAKAYKSASKQGKKGGEAATS